jgi:translation initiation factor IF-3
LDVKINKIQKFLDQGSKVKLSVFFRGREITHPEIGRLLLSNLVDALGDKVVIESEPQLYGKYLSMVIRKK